MTALEISFQAGLVKKFHRNHLKPIIEIIDIIFYM